MVLVMDFENVLVVDVVTEDVAVAKIDDIFAIFSVRIRS